MRYWAHYSCSYPDRLGRSERELLVLGVPRAEATPRKGFEEPVSASENAKWDNLMPRMGSAAV